MQPIIIEAIASGIWAYFKGIANFDNVRAINAIKTPINAAVSSYQTNFVVGDWIFLMCFREIKNLLNGFLTTTCASSKTALTALETAQASKHILAIKAIAT